MTHRAGQALDHGVSAAADGTHAADGRSHGHGGARRPHGAHGGASLAARRAGAGGEPRSNPGRRRYRAAGVAPAMRAPGAAGGGSEARARVCRPTRALVVTCCWCCARRRLQWHGRYAAADFARWAGLGATGNFQLLCSARACSHRAQVSADRARPAQRAVPWTAPGTPPPWLP
jgi:hypothetical protein